MLAVALWIPGVHAGVRWEPFLPETDTFGRGSYFSQSAYMAGTKTGKYTNAPPGVFFNGDPGIPYGYIRNHRAHFAPRAGLDADIVLPEGHAIGRVCYNPWVLPRMTDAWDRIDMGRLKLAKGMHEITMRATKPVERMEFYSLELAKPDFRAPGRVPTCVWA